MESHGGRRKEERPGRTASGKREGNEKGKGVKLVHRGTFGGIKYPGRSSFGACVSLFSSEETCRARANEEGFTLRGSAVTLFR
jgi:hypothetical protein